MPTGYTDSIKDVISFENFVLKCARNFGACIALRDESGDVLPTVDNIQFKNDDYHQKKLEQAKSDLLFFQNLSEEGWQSSFNKHVEDQVSYYREKISECEELLTQYNEMLAKVNDWIPPTEHHVDLKKFMKQQIEDSIGHDCDLDYYEIQLSLIKELTIEKFKEDKLNNAEYKIKYHSKHALEDSERNAKRVEWLQKLLDSLKQYD